MKHISKIIDEILVEWAYRVHDGMPNPKNTQHIQKHIGYYPLEKAYLWRTKSL